MSDGAILLRVSTPGRTRPNIVVVLTDDHAAHAIGAYGSVVNHTPHIDTLAADGVRVDHCFCTNALCAPSRASILTGTYSHVNGVTTLRTPLDTSQPTFVTALRQVGYRTAVFGKWHLGDGPDHDPQGFDAWELLIDQGEYFDPRFRHDGGLHVRPGYATDVITDLALGWLDDIDDDRPYCLLIHHKAPHRPWEPDAAHAGMFTDPIPVPATFDDDYASRTDAARRAAMRIADHLTAEDLKVDPPGELAGEALTRWKYQRYMEDYLACVASVDDNVGRVLERLDERGELDDTIVIYTSDQGFFLGDHGWYDKRFMYEQSIRMPMLVRYPPAIPAGAVVDAMVTNVDIAPTLLDAAGARPVAPMQGRSFWPLLTGRSSAPIHDAVYYRYFENDDDSHHVQAHYGVRTTRAKLVYFYNDGLGLPGTGDSGPPAGWELYDLVADPDEVVNRYDDPTLRPLRDELTAHLHRLQAELGDTPHPTDRS